MPMARHAARPPRARRHSETPGGRRRLGQRERAQLRTANILLRVTVRFAYLAVCTRVTMIVEHPARAAWLPCAASIWMLPQIDRLLQYPRVHAVTLDQCEFGGLSRKPTTLLCINAPGIVREVSQHPTGGRCSHGPLAHTAALGVDCRFQFRTAPLKDYPPGFCALLARGVLRTWHDWLAARPTIEGSPLPDELWALYVPTDPYDPVFTRGADFAPDAAGGQYSRRPPTRRELA